jgi:nucleotide-binding universal stress UspA family protein
MWVSGPGASLRSWRPVWFGRRVAVPSVRRIIVGVHGSPGSLQALRFAADEARRRNVPLLAVTAWVPPGGDLAERRHSSPYLRKIWREAAWEQLWTAFNAGLGGVPEDLRVETQAVRGETGPVLVEVAGQPDDLLVIGTGRRARFGRMMRRSVSRYCLAHARCPVLAVPPSALMDEMSHPLHSWHVRRHELLPDTPDM